MSTSVLVALGSASKLLTMSTFPVFHLDEEPDLTVTRLTLRLDTFELTLHTSLPSHPSITLPSSNQSTIQHILDNVASYNSSRSDADKMIVETVLDPLNDLAKFDTVPMPAQPNGAPGA